MDAPVMPFPTMRSFSISVLSMTHAIKGEVEVYTVLKNHKTSDFDSRWYVTFVPVKLILLIMRARVFSLGWLYLM